MGRDRNLCLFAHFDAHNRVEPYVLRYVDAIESCGFDVVFITASGITDSDATSLRRSCCDIIRRGNGGLDFGSWGEGHARYGRDFAGELLLANDSVYGPIGDLSFALDRLRAMPGDIRGMVESLQDEQHIQSWFILLSPRAHQSSAFREVMTQNFTALSKAEIITRGEIGLSKRLRAAGFTSAALFSLAHRVHDGGIVCYNPMHHVWREIIEIFGIPFIKVGLLRDNPQSISNLSQWRATIGSRAPELIAMIEEHLSRSGRGWAGAVAAAAGERLLAYEAFVRRDLRLDRSGYRIAREVHRWIFEVGVSLRERLAS